MYLLCEIYKNGYYLETDDDFLYIISDDLNMSYEKIRQILVNLIALKFIRMNLYICLGFVLCKYINLNAIYI